MVGSVVPITAIVVPTAGEGGASGQAGNIRITTGSLSAGGAVPTTSTFGRGKRGTDVMPAIELEFDGVSFDSLLYLMVMVQPGWCL